MLNKYAVFGFMFIALVLISNIQVAGLIAAISIYGQTLNTNHSAIFCLLNQPSMFSIEPCNSLITIEFVSTGLAAVICAYVAFTM
jgi:hypothetical protein